MIPTVFWEDYLLAVRAFSNGNPVPVICMFRQAALITASVPFEQPFADLTQWLGTRLRHLMRHAGIGSKGALTLPHFRGHLTSRECWLQMS